MRCTWSKDEHIKEDMRMFKWMVCNEMPVGEIYVFRQGGNKESLTVNRTLCQWMQLLSRLKSYHKTSTQSLHSQKYASDTDLHKFSHYLVQQLFWCKFNPCLWFKMTSSSIERTYKVIFFHDYSLKWANVTIKPNNIITHFTQCGVT